LQKKYPTREAFLLAAVEAFKPLFEKKEYKVPPVRVSTGWPHTKAVSAKSRRLAECWDNAASEDGVNQIFISPCLNDVTGPQGVLSILIHEVVHAVVGSKAAHGPVFKRCAQAVGLTGPMTSTVAGPELLEIIASVSEELGEYPHSKLDLLKSGRKKQGTRMVKCECPSCGYTVRTTKKWLDVAAPRCPIQGHGALHFELPEETDDSGEE